MEKHEEFKSFYRKYRPKKIDDISGHELIKKILKNQLENNNIPHALIFSGQRGTGKTSIAKIIAKTLNCEEKDGYLSCEKCENCLEANKNSHPDIFDIDGASNNGVDEIRQININVSLMPILGKYKVYIIDEVHMLTNSAFNAFLKTLEEPPKHIIFILATTELHSIPNTIISRCQTFNLRQISKKDIIDRINYVCKKENIKIDKESLNELVDLSDGSLRDAINNLDQLNSYCSSDITIEKFKKVFCVYTKNEKIKLILAAINNNVQEVIDFFKLSNNEGLNFKIFSISLINIIRDIIQWKLINVKDSDLLLEDDYEKFKDIDVEVLFEIGNKVIEAYSKTNNNVFSSDYLLLMLLEISNKNNSYKTNNNEIININLNTNNLNINKLNNNIEIKVKDETIVEETNNCQLKEPTFNEEVLRTEESELSQDIDKKTEVIEDNFDNDIEVYTLNEEKNINNEGLEDNIDDEDILFTQNVSRETSLEELNDAEEIEEEKVEEVEDLIYNEEYFYKKKKLWVSTFANDSKKNVVFSSDQVINALKSADKDERNRFKHEINEIFNDKSINFDKQLANDLVPLFKTRIICASNDSILFCEELRIEKNKLNLFFQEYENRNKLFKILDKELAIIVLDEVELKEIKTHYNKVKQTFKKFNFNLETFYDEIVEVDKEKSKIIEDAETIFGKDNFKVI